MPTLPGETLRPMFEDAIEMLALTWSSFRRHDTAALETAAALGRAIHKREKELTERLVAAAPEEAEYLRFIPGHLERIGDASEGVIRCLRGMEVEGTAFTERGMREVNELFERALELLECARDIMLTGNRVLGRHVEIESMRFQDRASDFARAHEERLVEGVCLPRASSAYLAILDYLRETTRHARRLAARVIGQRAPGEPHEVRETPA
jgi:Na+/phosphate symporter